MAVVCSLVSATWFWWGMIVPAIYAIAGAVWPNGGRTTFNAIYLAQNIGVATGLQWEDSLLV